ncbi:hypothetical protein MRX96_026477 [Rhipicephalus microplus]
MFQIRHSMRRVATACILWTFATTSWLKSTTIFWPLVLQTFYADHNAISNVTFGAFQWSPELQVIVLSDNKIESIGELAFVNLTRLRVVDLSHNRIASIPEDAFENTALERLNLSFNNMTHFNCIAAVKDTLRVLDLSGNRISSIGAHHFDGFHTMLALNFSQEPIDRRRRKLVRRPGSTNAPGPSPQSAVHSEQGLSLTAQDSGHSQAEETAAWPDFHRST